MPHFSLSFQISRNHIFTSELFAVSHTSLVFFFVSPLVFSLRAAVWIFSIHASSPLVILLSAVSNLPLSQAILLLILPLVFSPLEFPIDF